MEVGCGCPVFPGSSRPLTQCTRESHCQVRGDLFVVGKDSSDENERGPLKLL